MIEKCKRVENFLVTTYLFCFVSLAALRKMQYVSEVLDDVFINGIVLILVLTCLVTFTAVLSRVTPF